MDDSSVVGVLAEALAQHQHGASVPSSLRAECDKHLACTCGWVSSRCKRMSARDEHREHVASVVAALPNIAIVPLSPPNDDGEWVLGKRHVIAPSEDAPEWINDSQAAMNYLPHQAESLAAALLAGARAARAAGGQA